MSEVVAGHCCRCEKLGVSEDARLALLQSAECIVLSDVSVSVELRSVAEGHLLRAFTAAGLPAFP